MQYKELSLVEGGIPIRQTRLRKYGSKKRVLSLSIKILAVWYLVLWISSSFNGETNAYFSNQTGLTGAIQAGTWETKEDSGCPEEEHGEWDCSSLVFVDAAMTTKVITATVKNEGSDMKKEGKYAVYYIEKGNPQEGETLTESLTIKPLKEGEEVTLTFTPEKNGKYLFIVYQHEDYPGEKEIWSKEIIVDVIEERVKEVTEQEESYETMNVDTNDKAIGKETEEKSEEELNHENKQQVSAEDVTGKEAKQDPVPKKPDPEKPDNQEEMSEQPKSTDKKEQQIENNATRQEADVEKARAVEVPQDTPIKEEKMSVTPEITKDEQVNQE